MRLLIRVSLISAVLVLSLASGGCASREKREKKRRNAEEAAAKTVPALRGTIALVNEEEQFVLIDGGPHPSPAPGAALKSFTGDVESGVLTVGNVRRRPFTIADIVSGTPQKGDQVFQ